VNTALAIQPYLRPLRNGQLLFELSNQLPSRTQPSTLSGRITCSASVINVIFTHPAMRSHLMGTKIRRGLFDLAAMTNKRNRALTKFRWTGTGHNGEPFKNAID